MKLAIVGGGLSGLAIGYFLAVKRGFSVTIFDEKKGGASSVCAGLLHPYPGRRGTRTPYALEGIEATKKLLNWASQYGSLLYSERAIWRGLLDLEQVKQFERHRQSFGDILDVESSHCIPIISMTQSMSVDTPAYLTALCKGLSEHGVSFVYEKVKHLQMLSEFDHIVLAAGFGMRELLQDESLFEQNPLYYLKGQILSFEGVSPFGRSYVSKGYIVDLSDLKQGNSFSYQLGATYEKTFADDRFDMDIAAKMTQEHVEGLVGDRPIADCRSGVRVATKQGILPLLSHPRKGISIMTALGSRGLLYHALYAQELVTQMCKTW